MQIARNCSVRYSKMTLETSKNLGGVGAILMVIGFFGTFVPYAGILELIGLILLLIGLKGLADYYHEGGIFNNALYAIIIGIVGAVVAVAAIVVTAVAVLLDMGIDLANVSDWSTFGADFASRFTDLSALWGLIGAVVLGLVILFVVAIVAAIFFRKSLTTLSAKTGVGLFATAGLLMLIGAVLTIIIIGVLIIWIALILIAVAFFQTKAQPAQAPPAPPPS
jgi:uncharacterized membrane protein